MSESVITVQGLRKTYGSLVAVDDVSFEVRRGEIFGLIGPNGAGKTTTMECVQGHRKGNGGDITVLGLHPRRDGRRLQKQIGVQHQEAQLQKRIKVWEAVDLWSSLYDGVVETDVLLEQLGLTAKRNAWFMTLSGGQKQRLFIALALIHDPEIVFLDELTTGLDPQARRAIWSLVTGIRDRGKTVFLTTHLMEEAERLCDRVGIIEHGRLIAMDTPEALVHTHCPERSVVFAAQPNGNEPSTRGQTGLDLTGVFDRLPGITRVSRDNGRYRLDGAGDEFVTDVINLLAEKGIRVQDFRTEIPNLEDVFLRLTGHSIRD